MHTETLARGLCRAMACVFAVMQAKILVWREAFSSLEDSCVSSVRRPNNGCKQRQQQNYYYFVLFFAVIKCKQVPTAASRKFRALVTMCGLPPCPCTEKMQMRNLDAWRKMISLSVCLCLILYFRGVLWWRWKTLWGVWGAGEMSYTRKLARIRRRCSFRTKLLGSRISLP